MSYLVLLKCYRQLISSISPSSGVAGTIVTITGTNFNTNGDYYNSGNIVMIGDVQATISASEAGSLKVTVPSGLKTGSYKVKISTSVFSVVSPADFNIVSPAILDFTPKSASPGTAITITGTNLKDYNSHYNTVLFGTYESYPTEVYDDKIITLVPNGTQGGAMKLSLVLGGVTITSSDNFTLTAPKLSSFSPVSGVPGTHVIITGEGFSPQESYNQVYFGDVLTKIVSASATSLEVLVPTAVPGAVKISVKVDERTSTSTNNFTIKQL